MTTVTEIRCPFGSLFGKLRGQFVVTEGNLAEFACSNCKKAAREYDPTVHQVLHRYDLVGELVETVVQRPDQPIEVFVGSDWAASDITGELRLRQERYST